MIISSLSQFIKRFCIFLFCFSLVIQCNSDEKSNNKNSLLKTNKQEKSQKWSKVEYYKYYTPDLQGNFSYKDKISKEEAKGLHIKVFYNDQNQIVQDEIHNEFGIVVTHFTYDKNNKIKIKKAYDEDNTPIFTRYYNENQKLIKEQHYSSGEPTDYIIFQYNDKNQIIREDHLAENDFLISYQTYEYDKNNNPIQTNFYDRNDRLMYYNKNIYDENNTLISVENRSGNNSINSKNFFDPEGKVIKYEQYLNKNLEHIDEYKIDEHGNYVKWKTTYYKQNGKVEKTFIFTYNKDGILTKTSNKAPVMKEETAIVEEPENVQETKTAKESN